MTSEALRSRTFEESGTQGTGVRSDDGRSARRSARSAERALTDHVIEWNGEPIKKIRKGFMEAVKRAKLKDVTPHVLRHTVLTWLDEDGIPMERISKLAGHRDINTTRTIYAKPGVKVLRPLADVIDMRLRRKSGEN